MLKTHLNKHNNTYLNDKYDDERKKNILKFKKNSILRFTKNDTLHVGNSGCRFCIVA